nr:MAG TPA: hypothetical protein [Caudoviricetes sp.]DAS15279.1 MAG TPA: hypothetical protein [Caudoviricetes sp.]
MPKGIVKPQSGSTDYVLKRDSCFDPILSLF